MLILFTFITIAHSQIPDRFRYLADKALANSKTKKLKTLREPSKPPGYYETPNYHFELLETLTSSSSNDIKGYSIDKSYIALVKRKNYNLKENFVFVDTETDTLYKVSDIVASENNVAIHKCEETSIFKIMTNFELHFRSKSQKINTKKKGSSISPQESANFEYSYNWNAETNLPTYETVQETPLQYGYGGAFKVEIDMTFSFNSLRDIKFAGQVEFEGFMGAGIKVESNYEHNFEDIELLGKSFAIPNFALDKQFHFVTIKIGGFLNLNSQLRGLKLIIPVGFEYFKGYKAHAKKYIEITPYTTTDSDWIMNIQPLPEENNADTTDVLQTIESAKFEGTLNIALSFSFNIEIASLKKKFEFGINSPIKCTFSLDTTLCLFPYLSAVVEIPFNMFVTIPSIEILGITIIKEDYNQVDLVKIKITTPKFCIGPNAGIEQAQNKIQTPEEITVSINGFPYDYTWKDGETTKLLKAKIPEEYIGSYFLLLNQHCTASIEGNSKSLNANINYIKITDSTVNFAIQKSTEAKSYFSVCYTYLPSDEVPLSYFGVINEYHFAKNLFNAILLPIIGDRIYLMTNPVLEIYKMATINEETLFVLFKKFSDDAEVKLTLQYTQITDLQPFLDVDLTYAYDINHLEGVEIDYEEYDYAVYCNNAKSIILKQNNEIIAEVNEDQKIAGLFTFSIPIDTTGIVTFIPVCKDETGKMCQLSYTPTSTGYDVIKYPNRDGISTTGSGFYVEAIPVKSGEKIDYYKTYKESISKITSYTSTEPISIVPKYESSKTRDATNEKRVCLYKSDDSTVILPFSRKYFSEHLEELLEQLHINVQNDDYSGINSDDDGCIVFPSSFLPSGETNIEIKHLVKEVCDIPIVEINIEDPGQSEGSNEPENSSENEPEVPSENDPVKPDKIKYYCICSDDSICKECTNGIQTNEVQTSSSISQDPGTDVTIRIYSNAEISSSIFTQDHDVVVDSRFNLNITNADNVDVSDTTKLKVDKLSFTSGENVNIKPKSSELKITLSTVAAGKDFNVEISDSLKLTVTNQGSNIIAPTLNIKGTGEVNTYDYPFDKITSDPTVKLIKGVSIICKPQENGEKCDQTSYKDYKVLNHFQNMESNFDKNSKICIFLHTYNDAYIDVDINRLDSQELLLVKQSSSLLLEETTKLRVLSTTVLSNNRNNVVLEGSKGSTSLGNDYVEDLVVGFDKLTVKQDESYNTQQPKITVQAQSKNSIIVIDDSVQFAYQSYKLDSTVDGSEISVYYGDRDTSELPSNWEMTDKIEEIQPKPGLPPPEKDGKGGLGKSAIIGIVVAVVVVVIAVVAVLVYIFVIRKKRRQDTDDENDDKNNDNMNI
ncbi:hypothetical protein M9Y10_005201 [Tritrichomonas musculus]|uniref:Uncharacterized protein n=1 Tax=Tritrichomonas musculus TaxID=1915356 RepID=A0ABR2JKK1_9EUKA